jgi:hypothetical protein
MSDSEDSQLDSAYEKLVESSSSSAVGAGIKKKKAFTTTIVKWPCITHTKVNADGSKITTHPIQACDYPSCGQQAIPCCIWRHCTNMED